MSNDNEAQSQPDYYSLYLQEIKRNEDLKQEITFFETQAKNFARQLANVHEHAKRNKRDSALQLKEFEKDLNLKQGIVLEYARDFSTITADLKKKNKKLLEMNQALEKVNYDLQKVNADLQEAYRDTIHRLVLASEYKDNETGGHINRMCGYSALLAKLFGLSEQEIAEIELAAPMHDVGKIGIPDHIILKNGKLTDEEFTVIKSHTVIGAGILKSSKVHILECARQIALFHHEKWNGRGYPEGISGLHIPIMARIVAICDTFDALTSKRPYKNPYPIEVSCDIIKKEKGQHFDPDLTDVFLNNIEKFAEIKSRVDAAEGAEEETGEFAWSERDKARDC